MNQDIAEKLLILASSELSEVNRWEIKAANAESAGKEGLDKKYSEVSKGHWMTYRAYVTIAEVLYGYDRWLFEMECQVRAEDI